jgi:redox-sensitive bicupin YhaK (pirin superfamily)
LADPYFTMFWNAQIPRFEVADESGNRSVVKLIVGDYQGQEALSPPPDSWAAQPEHDVQVWRISMEPDAQWTLPATTAEHGRMLYFYSGERLQVAQHWLTESTGVQLKASADLALTNGSRPAELLLLSGRPIGEAVAQHGPFVMNNRAELMQAFVDYRNGVFGGWPWSSEDPVHARDRGRFAVHADGRIDAP